MLLLADLKQLLAWPRPWLTSPYIGISTKRVNADSHKDSKTLEEQCLEHAWRLYPHATSIQPVDHQGGCSHTLLVKRGPSSPAIGSKAPFNSDEITAETLVLQFRPQRFALDLTLCRRAHKTYGSLVPTVNSGGQIPAAHSERDVYELSIVPGVRFDVEQSKNPRLDEHSIHKLENLLRGFASFFATGLGAANSERRWHGCTGEVGSSLISRLQRLSLELPTLALRTRASETLSAVQAGALDALPVVLSHGDLLPSNIMVSPATWQLNGLVDWAEAEDLPFGVGLYGVEHLLGFMEDGSWVWYEQAPKLRVLFWDYLVEELPELDGEVEKGVLMAQEVGILLWHGFAWDDGKIDRVINEEDNQEEVTILRAFLEASAEESSRKWKPFGKRDSKMDFEC